MALERRKMHFIIWAFAFGYFAFYTPYSASVKVVSSGLWPGADGVPSRLEILPGALLSSAVVVLLFITFVKWWRHVPIRRVLDLPVLCPSPLVALSGLGTVAIIATTTLAYTFHGVSIVLALLLMRGGVLIMAPLVDLLFRRRVAWNSWLGLALSLAAVTVALADQNSYELSLAAIANLLCYYLGYVIRLQCITAAVKAKGPESIATYFAQEQTVSMLLLVLIGSGLTWYAIGSGDFPGGLTGVITLPGLLIGVLYGGLFVFGSLIYMDARENSFCIPVNRCSSVLAGVVASFLLAQLFEWKTVSTAQLTGAAIIVSAILMLALPSLATLRRRAQTLAHGSRKLLLFVCDGNTSRSPMAQAICSSEIVRRLSGATLDGAPVQFDVVSAGLKVDSGQPMSANARLALDRLRVAGLDHAARPLDDGLVERAHVIYCMNTRQCDDLTARFPQARAKTFCLDPNNEIGNPAGASLDEFVACARQIQRNIVRRLEELDLLPAGLARAGS